MSDGCLSFLGGLRQLPGLNSIAVARLAHRTGPVRSESSNASAHFLDAILAREGDDNNVEDNHHDLFARSVTDCYEARVRLSAAWRGRRPLGHWQK